MYRGPRFYWDPVAAVISYDGQLATSGITTVLDSLRVWREGSEDIDGQAGVLAKAIADAREASLLRTDHFLHLRCEVPTPHVVEEAKELIDRPDVRLMSLMDHTPGQRQFRDEGKLRDYYRGKSGGLSDAELDVMFARRFEFQEKYAAANMQDLVALAQSRNITIASHDDTTEENVADAIRDRVSVAEFPTTIGSGAGTASGRHPCADGRAECGARRFAFGQYCRHRSRPRRAARYHVIGLYPPRAC